MSDGLQVSGDSRLIIARRITRNQSDYGHELLALYCKGYSVKVQLPHESPASIQ
jgi:hypothetical protein